MNGAINSIECSEEWNSLKPGQFMQQWTCEIIKTGFNECKGWTGSVLPISIQPSKIFLILKTHLANVVRETIMQPLHMPLFRI